jgi:hypothetical protein
VQSDTLRRAAALMRERADAMATLLTLEQGKPLAEAQREVRLSADIIDFQAEEARRLYGRSVPPLSSNEYVPSALPDWSWVRASVPAWSLSVPVLVPEERPSSIRRK